jgi:hypothetical protein
VYEVRNEVGNTSRAQIIQLEYATSVKPQSYNYVLQYQPINIKPDIHSPNEVTALIYGF